MKAKRGNYLISWAMKQEINLKVIRDYLMDKKTQKKLSLRCTSLCINVFSLHTAV